MSILKFFSNDPTYPSLEDLGFDEFGFKKYYFGEITNLGSRVFAKNKAKEKGKICNYISKVYGRNRRCFRILSALMFLYTVYFLTTKYF